MQRVTTDSRFRFRRLKTSLDGLCNAVSVARIYAALGKKDEALRWLEIAYKGRAPFMVFLKTEPRFDDLRCDPRFEDLLRRMNFPP